MQSPGIDKDPRWDRRYSPALPGLPVEVTTVTELRRREGDDSLRTPGRVMFHVALICTQGEGLHEVDFVPVNLRPGRVVHIRPGQVHRWRFARPYQAALVLFASGSGQLAPTGGPMGPRWFDLDESEASHARELLRLVRRETRIERSAKRRNRALSGALETLIVALGLDLPRQDDTGHLPGAYLGLLEQLEIEPGWSRSVSGRARLLGFSQRTLTRACLAATGHTAKQVIDDRVLLEAQRLLVDGQPVSTVASVLDFPDAASFSKFFQRTAGESPTSWRRRNVPHRSTREREGQGNT